VPDAYRHSHDHRNRHDAGHGHSHGLVHDSIWRSREGIQAVSLSLAVLAVAAIAQAAVFTASGSVALLADLIHNFGDELTAVPLGIAFALRSRVAERRAGLVVVAAIFVSACVAGVEAGQRMIDPSAPRHLGALAVAGAIGWAGNLAAAPSARARVAGCAARRSSPTATIPRGRLREPRRGGLRRGRRARRDHADPLIALAITLVILRITWQSWRTVRGHRAR